MKKCLACGGGPVKMETRQASFRYNRKILRYDQPGQWCAECGEVFLEKSDKDATDALIYNFQAKLDGRLTTDDILRIRKKLGLKTGDSVKLFDYDGAIHVIPTSKNPVKEAVGILARRPSLSRKLLKDRATE